MNDDTIPSGDELAQKFEEQFPDLTVGGFYNPTIEADDGKIISFRCHYDGYGNVKDSWHWDYNRQTGVFSS